DIILKGLRARLAERSLALEITPAAREVIIENGYDPVYGARPLKRYLQSSAETLIARKILEGSVSAGSVIRVDAEDGKLTAEVR
ncbi:MAG: hypothetical protein IIZ66_09710, partial [Clostridia bacterium]|nr:hypothetical protein [Clostridia bacterium]